MTFGEMIAWMVVLIVSLAGNGVLGETRAGYPCLGSLSTVPDPPSSGFHASWEKAESEGSLG